MYKVFFGKTKTVTKEKVTVFATYVLAKKKA